MSERIKNVLIAYGTVIALGAVYSVIVSKTGWGVPCPIRFITGLKCPGCGVTGMCMALLRFDIKAAFSKNAVLLCSLPYFIALAARITYLYIKKGVKSDRFINISATAMIPVFLIWGILRNIFGL